MRMIVCIKQVPGSSEVEMDENGNLIRDPNNVKMNPFDLYAIETALQIKESMPNDTPSTIAAITMGPPQAKSVLREAFMMGVDEGVLLSDRKFAGADVWATAFTLAQGIKKHGVPDLIICGKQTTDGDTAQVGAELAEFLNIPHITNVIKIGKITRESIILECDLPTSVQLTELKFPCLITVDKDIYIPRLPSYKKKKLTENWMIPILSYTDLEDKNTYHYGMNGSPTKVKRIFLPEAKTDKEIWKGTNEEIVAKLYAQILKEKII